MPFNALDPLLNFVKGKDRTERSTLSASTQLESVEVFNKYYKVNQKQLNSKVFETVILHYFAMLFSFKITALGLLPPSTDLEAAAHLPLELQTFFDSHVHNVQLTDSGFAGMQDFYTLHLPFFSANSGYLPPEMRRYFINCYRQNDELGAATKRKQSVGEDTVTPIVSEGSFSAAKKQKKQATERIDSEEEVELQVERRTSARLAEKEKLASMDVTEEHINETQDPDNTESDTSR